MLVWGSTYQKKKNVGLGKCVLSDNYYFRCWARVLVDEIFSLHEHRQSHHK